MGVMKTLVISMYTWYQKTRRFPNVWDGYDLEPKLESPGNRIHWKEKGGFLEAYLPGISEVLAKGDKVTHKSQGDVTRGSVRSSELRVSPAWFSVLTFHRLHHFSGTHLQSL